MTGIGLKKPIQYLKGVGPAKEKLFKAIGVDTVGDLVAYFPRQYEDRTVVKRLDEIIDGEMCSTVVICASQPVVHYARKNLSYVKCSFTDEKSILMATWFNQPYVKRKLVVGKKYLLYGKFTKKLMLEITNPVLETFEQNSCSNKILPIYSLANNLTQNYIRKISQLALNEALPHIYETLPNEILSRYNLMPLNESIENVHFPESNHFKYEARRRLAFEELLEFQLGLLKVKNDNKSNKCGIKFNVNRASLEHLFKFEFTNAQSRVLEEIINDMSSASPMCRLIQGDVGSGKTAIALVSMLISVENGYQTVLMAPTEILAEQHLQTFSEVLEKRNVSVAILKGAMKKSEKAAVLETIKNGTAQIVIGTHALLEENVQFANLGLVVTDEQHRFGVRQRNVLSSKAETPDVLIMTATPIPRTLALVLYCDLDISTIDELPPGRQQIKTYAIKTSQINRALNFIDEQIQSGQQAYVVCPLIEQSEVIEAKSAQEFYEELCAFYPNYKIALLHGKMKNSEKESIMRGFAANKINILVSTTVIEVGINVPNATIMLVQNAERFGLAQLHQLRGRVGRGAKQSYCILSFEGNSKVALERLKIMQETIDGFKIAQKDLELRGPGDFFGTAQHGLPELKVANLYEDIDIIKDTRAMAIDILLNNKLVLPEYETLKTNIEKLLTVNMN